MRNTRVMVFMALFIAMHVIFARFLSFQTLTLRISFEFLPIAFAAIMFGPVAGGLTGAIADVVGFFIFPKGTYFPGFTLSAFLTGAIYGLFLHRKQRSILRIILAAAAVVLIVDISLGTVWLHTLLGTPYKALILTRLVKLAMVPVEVVLVYILWRCISLTETYFVHKEKTI